jgi:hypothetical protein
MAAAILPGIIPVEEITNAPEQGGLTCPQVKVNGTKPSVGWHTI